MRTIELFAGAGGAALGLHRAGLEHLALVEWDKDACATLRAAIAAGMLDGEVIEGDVRAVDWTSYAGRCDLLWASPPCQAWSSAGKRLGASDDRNGWPWTFDVIDAVRPTWFLAENVPGLTHLAGECESSAADCCPGHYWDRTILPAVAARFPWSGWAEINASSYGVPQHRRRIFLAAGPRPIAWPAPTHADPAEIRQGGLFAAPLLPWVTVREALNLDAALRPERGQGMQERHGFRRDHPPTEPAPQIGAGSAGSGPRLQIVYKRGRDGGVADEAHTVDEPSCALRGAPGGSSQPFLLSDRDHRERVLPLDAPAPTLRAQGNVDASGHLGGHASLFVLDPKHPPSDLDAPAHALRSGGDGHSAPPAYLAGSRPELLDRPSPTVSAVGECKGIGEGAHPEKMQRASDALFLGAGIRRLSVAECATLQAFPPDWPWQGTKTAKYRQVGNAVASPVAEALARSVLAASSLPATEAAK